MPTYEGAICATVDPDLWFSDFRHDLERAQAMCDACPAKDACLRDALRRGEQYGMFGGVLFSPRRDPTRHLPSKGTLPCGTEAAYQRHRRHGQIPCDTCQDAHEDHNTSRRAAS